MPVPQQIPIRSAADYLDVMTRVAFQSGLSWQVVDAKWDGFREAFDGFDPDTVADYTEAKIEELVRDERIIRNRRKIEATVHNAARLAELDEDVGFRTWLRTRGDYAETVAAIRKTFKYLGPQGIHYFLYVVGEDVPDREEIAS